MFSLPNMTRKLNPHAGQAHALRDLAHLVGLHLLRNLQRVGHGAPSARRAKPHLSDKPVLPGCVGRSALLISAVDNAQGATNSSAQRVQGGAGV